MYQLSKSLTVPFLAIALLLVALLACGGEAVSPTAEQTEAGVTAVPEPSSTPEPTPVSPDSIPGIDEPVVVGKVKVQVLEAYTQDSLSSDERTVHPDDPSDIFLEILVAIDGAKSTFDWAADNMRLVHGGEEFGIVRQGRKGGAGGTLAGYFFVFSVPKESKSAEYALELAGEVRIDLAPFFQ